MDLDHDIDREDFDPDYNPWDDDLVGIWDEYPHAYEQEHDDD